MANQHHIKQFTAADIERYHQGLLSAKERHDLEKAALEDPFLADALEGYAVAGTGIQTDLSDLKKRLAAKTEGTKVVPMRSAGKQFSPMLRVAAMVILLAGAGLLVYQFAFNKKDKELAQAKPTTEKTAEISGLINDSAGIPADNKPSTTTTGNSTTVLPAEKADAITLTPEKSIPPAPVTKPEANPAAPLKKENDITENKPSIVSGEIKSAPGSGIAVVSPKPVVSDRSAEEISDKLKDKETAREESKTRSVAAKKQEEDIDAYKKKQIRQTDDERKNLKQVTAGQQQNKYYDVQAMNTFRGRVTDPNNVGLPFANVTNVRDNVGTYTDANGNFVLTSPDTVLAVQVRSIGYEYNNVQLRNNLPANRVVMQEDRQVLSEVVTTTQKPNAAARSVNNNRTLVEPEPIDGWANYDSYLANNLNLPEEYSQQKTTETKTVELSFEVDKNGEPVNIRVEKSLCNSCDKEAIRLVKDGPKWKRNAGKKGRTRVTINF